MTPFPPRFDSIKHLHTSSKALLIVVGLLTACLALADERDDRIRALEQRVEQLEKTLQARETNAAATTKGVLSTDQAKPGPAISIGASGFSMSSADGNFALRFRGLLQADSQWDLGGGDLTDSFLIRRARPILEGTVFRDFDFRLAPEFGGSSTVIRDAWLNYRYNDALELRFGKMKSPGALERWQSAANIPFVERSLVSLLWPVREVGVMAHGDLWTGDEDTTKSLAANGLVNYELGGFNGTGDGRAEGNTDFDNGKSLEGRLFFHPFLKTGLEPWRKLGLGLAANYGNMEGSAGLPDDIQYETDLIADGTHWRIGPQAYWYWGRFGLQAEYALSSQRLRQEIAPFDSVRADNNAWAITASWMLTGEPATFRTVAPRRSFDPRAGAWGAWQLVARYSSLDIDDDLFPTFADPAELPTDIANWGVGLNWFLNRNIRASVNYNHYDFEGGQGSAVGQAEHLFATRVQLAF